MPETNEVRYLGANSQFYKDPKFASRFRKDSFAAQYSIRHIPTEFSPHLIDGTLVLGTYISTYNGKFKFDRIVDIVCRNNVTAILSLPILLPIALLIRFIKMYNQYVTNHR